jgi:hypothetical protein
MKTQFCLFAVSVLVCAGCHKAEQIEKPNTAPLPKISVESDTTQPAPAAKEGENVAPPAPGEEGPPPAADMRTQVDDSAIDAETINSMLADFRSETRKIPKTMDDLVKWKLLPAVPKPPPGKQYVIDGRGVVKLVDAK